MKAVVQKVLAPVVAKSKVAAPVTEYIGETIRLYNRDSTESLISMLGTAVFDLVYFDPMFKPQTTQNNYKPFREKNRGEMIEPIYPDRKTYNATFKDWLFNAVLFCKPSGWIVIKIDDFTFAECWPMIKRKTAWAKNVVWNKGRIGTGRMFRGQHELLVFCRPKKHVDTYFQAPSVFQKGVGRSIHHGSSHGLAIPSVWTVYAPNQGEYGITGSRLHINQTPLKLYDRLFQAFIPPAGSVLDLCMGSGSLGKACRQHRCSYVGFELQPAIFTVAKDGILKAPVCKDLVGFTKQAGDNDD